MNLPAKDLVLIPTGSHQERAVALVAAFTLSAIVEEHNEQQRATKAIEDLAETDEPFLWGQDFSTEPEVWDADGWEYLTDPGDLSDL